MKTVAFPLPQGLQFGQWGALVAEQLADYGISPPSEDNAWTDWACSLLAIPELAALPSPLGFADWSQWAQRVLETI